MLNLVSNMLSLCLQPLILLSFEDRLLWFHDTINIGRAFLSFLSHSGVAWSGSVALLLCRLRLSKSIESMNVGVYVVH